VDEALSVGDVFFQQKCSRRIQQMRERGTTMLFVSHDLAAVEALCDRVLLLHGGRVKHDGDEKAGIRLYYAVGGSGARGDVAPIPLRHDALEARPQTSPIAAADPSGDDVPPFPEIRPDELSWN